ncbi:CHAT domain-containing protein [Amycolatopsis sp. NPDC026612]|uniref:CHAT domain-containing protein n=1 Tax=Amycolatopsis sp. NPDC026612 TaxID=3155466 RepID=UPI0033F47ED8
MPRRWPFNCRGCGRPADPVFAEPWEHESRGFELRSLATSAGKTDREIAGLDLIVWRYETAFRDGDRAGADAARADLRATAARLRAEDPGWSLCSTRFRMVGLAVGAGELTAAAHEVLAFFEDVRNLSEKDLEHSRDRGNARLFFHTCLVFLGDPRSVGHREEARVTAAMTTIGNLLRASDYLTAGLETGYLEAMRLRAALHGAARPAAPEWVPPAVVTGADTDPDSPPEVHARLGIAAGAVAAAKDGTKPETLAATLDDMAALVTASGSTRDAARAAELLADAALTVAEAHDDPAPLFAAAGRLAATSPLARLLRARGHLIAGRLENAGTEAAAALTEPGSARPEVLSHLHAVRGWTLVRLDPARLDAGIEDCRRGRATARAKRTPADLPLARLLVEKALHQDTPAEDAVPLLREARALCGQGGADADLVVQEAGCALAALTGRGDLGRRARAWRTAVRNGRGAPVAARMRLATAWVRWALGTTEIEAAAEAYHHLVSLIPEAVRIRYRAEAKTRVLTSLREHTEEAGYWLARAGRFRDAAVALETGRAVALSTLLERDDPRMAEALHEAGRGDLLARYRQALADVQAHEREPGGTSHRTWTVFRTLTREIADVIGADPEQPVVEYTDITSATGDGAVVYVAAARASGYAMVVAARHDPQCVWLPDLARGAVEAWLHGQAGHFVRRAQRLKQDLDRLWASGLRDLLAFYAHGPIVTLVPVGVMTLLPLHATPRHPVPVSPIRYAPNARTLRWCGARSAALAGRPARLLVADVPDAPGMTPLPHAAGEAATVAAAWSGQCTAQSRATWARFAAAARDHDVWHIACHGQAVPHAIMESRLAFADRKVTINDLRDRLPYAPRRLAIVSACDMHTTGDELPNETIGLPSALLQLGFAGVIAASWPVNDLATAYLMVRFHREWRRGRVHPAVALTWAQKWLRDATPEDLAVLAPSLRPPDTGSRPFTHPFYWAAFAYTGG